MFLPGSAEEEGDVEVTHCNIIAMAMRSRLGEGGWKGEAEQGFPYGLSRDGNDCRALQQKRETRDVSVTVNSELLLKATSVFVCLPLSPRLPRHCFTSAPPPSSFLSVLLHSPLSLLSSSFLFRRPVASSALWSRRNVFSSGPVALSHVTRVFGHAEAECLRDVSICTPCWAGAKTRAWCRAEEKGG